MGTVEVRLPRLLARTAGVPYVFEVEATDTDGVVAAMHEAHPALRGHLVEAGRGLRTNVLCAVDGRAVRLDHPVPVHDGSTVVFTRSVAGG